MSYYPCKPTALQLTGQQESRVNPGEPMTFQHLVCFSPGLATVHWHKQVAVIQRPWKKSPKLIERLLRDGMVLSLDFVHWLPCTHVIASRGQSLARVVLILLILTGNGQFPLQPILV